MLFITLVLAISTAVAPSLYKFFVWGDVKRKSELYFASALLFVFAALQYLALIIQNIQAA